jgi:hypothetical protein
MRVERAHEAGVEARERAHGGDGLVHDRHFSRQIPQILADVN